MNLLLSSIHILHYSLCKSDQWIHHQPWLPVKKCPEWVWVYLMVVPRGKSTDSNSAKIFPTTFSSSLLSSSFWLGGSGKAAWTLSVAISLFTLWGLDFCIYERGNQELCVCVHSCVYVGTSRAPATVSRKRGCNRKKRPCDSLDFETNDTNFCVNISHTLWTLRTFMKRPDLLVLSNRHFKHSQHSDLQIRCWFLGCGQWMNGGGRMVGDEILLQLKL